VPSNTSQPLGQPMPPVAGQIMSVPRPPVQAWGQPLPPHRPPGPGHPPPTVSSSAVPPLPHQPVMHGGEFAGQHTGGDISQMQFTSQPPLGPPRLGHPQLGGPPPMNQPGVPPPNMPPVNPGPQTMMNVGFGAPPLPPESRAPNLTSHGFPMAAGMHPPTSEMSSASQFTGILPPPSQMNAGGMAGYNYSQPRVMPPPSTQPQSAGLAAAGTSLAGPMTQPQPRKLDPDQMPSPVSQCVLLCE